MTAAPVNVQEMFDAADGRRLFEQHWLPGGDPRAHLAIVHGYAEHSGRYTHVGEALAARGYAVHALDLRGHGRSDGARAIVRSFDEFLLDMRAFTARVRERAGGRPVFLLGHSMGGAIVALELAVGRPRLAGALLSGAVLPSPARGGRLARTIIGLIGRLFPRLPLIKLNAEHVSRDPDVVRRYDQDPLVYRGRIRAGMVAAMGRAVRYIEKHGASIDAPILIMHGTQDQLASPEGSQRLFDAIASSDKTLKLYEGLHHEILNEPEQAQVISDIVEWMDARSSA
jgi:alpha-beta hydrolase superfamily lysophospholipase